MLPLIFFKYRNMTDDELGSVQKLHHWGLTVPDDCGTWSCFLGSGVSTLIKQQLLSSGTLPAFVPVNYKKFSHFQIV